MTFEILRVWKGDISHKDYVCHLLLLVSDASYLQLSEYIKDNSEKGGKRFTRAELFGVRTCKMDCSVWLTKDGKPMLKSALDLDRQNSDSIVETAIKFLDMQTREEF